MSVELEVFQHPLASHNLAKCSVETASLRQTIIEYELGGGDW